MRLDCHCLTPSPSVVVLLAASSDELAAAAEVALAVSVVLAVVHCVNLSSSSLVRLDLQHSRDLKRACLKPVQQINRNDQQ